MRKRTRYSLLAAIILLAALGVALFLRFHAPPEVARLLPESDAILYLNLKPIRAATHFDDKPIAPGPDDYKRFITATGIHFEHDLDRIALALHRMPNANGPNGPVAYDEVFEGRFDGNRLTTYLASISNAQETYAGHTIFTIPVQDPSRPGPPRVVRVATLGYDMVAASNMPTGEQIHSILDRYATAASPLSGSSLLSARYRDVPLFSLAWGIGHIGLPFSESGKITAFGLTLPLSEDTDFIASLVFRGTTHLRVEELTPTEKDAAQSAETLSTILNLVRGFAPSTGTPEDASVHQLLESVKIDRKGERVILTGTIPPALLKNLTAPTAPAAP